MSIITLCKVVVFPRGNESYESTLIMRNNICNTTFLTYKVSNSAVNGIIFFVTK